MSPQSKSPTQLRIFLSYASEQCDAAEQIALALTNSGHEVFFDRESIPGGSDYNASILERLRSSDLIIFLISPTSVQDGRYSRTELRFTQEVWKSPKGRVLPVLAAPTPLDLVPNYLKAVSILKPEGSLAAEALAAVNDLASGWSPEEAVAAQSRTLKDTTRGLERVRLAQQLTELDERWERARKQYPASINGKEVEPSLQLLKKLKRIPIIFSYLI